jgi:hypothetical protein
MAYDEALAGRVRAALADRTNVSERAMFGGLAFMVGGHMACGVVKDELMLSLGAAAAEEALALPGVRPMDFTGRPMRGKVFVGPEAVATASAVKAWVDRAAAHASSLPPR